MWYLSSPYKSPPWQPVVETNMWLFFFFFCRIQSNLAPCDSLYAKTPSHTHISSRPSLLYTRQCLRKESFCVLGLFFVYVLCCTPQPSYHRCTHTHTSATEPLSFFFLQSLTFVRPGRPGLVQRDTDPDPATLRHRMPVWSLSWVVHVFFLFVRSKLLSSFRT